MNKAILLVILPGVLANIMHMALVKLDGFKALKVPVNVSLFGTNKTWRGFLFLTVATALFSLMSAVLFELTYWYIGCYIGALLGFMYMLFELPNSYLKRRMGIGSGEAAKKNTWLFALLDKTDSAFGVCLVYWMISDLHWKEGILLFILSSFSHISISFLLVILNIKKRF